MKEITTIKLSKKTAELLNKLKIHPRQSYEEVILESLKKQKPRKLGKKGTYAAQLIFSIILLMIIATSLVLLKGGITGQVAASSDLFEVVDYSQIKEPKTNAKTLISSILVVLLSILITIVAMRYINIQKEKKRYELQRKIKELVEKKEGVKIVPERDITPLIKFYEWYMKNNIPPPDNILIEKGWKPEEIKAAKEKAAGLLGAKNITMPEIGYREKKEIQLLPKETEDSEFKIMDKGLLESVMKESPRYLNDVLYKNIKMLHDIGYDINEIKAILINKGYDLIDIDYAIETFKERAKKKR